VAGQFTFKAVAMGRRAAGQMLLGRLWVSSLAKTFFDCFYRPGYAGGYSTLSKALFSAELDWREFLSYFERFASDSLCQRTAYVIDLVREASKKVPKHVLDYFSRRVRTRTRLVPTAAGAGKWVARWQVMDNLGKDAILEWCHG
jgi:predicted transcriptional regulator of viral defense system